VFNIIKKEDVMNAITEKGDKRRPNLNPQKEQHQRAAGNKPGHEDKGGQYNDKKDRLGKQKQASLNPQIKPDSKPKIGDDRGKKGAAEGDRGKGSK
jgi:hypothetical protein